MGYTYWEFWEMNPRILKPLVEGYRLRKKSIDENNWILGGYVYSAVSLALGNAFRKKNQKSKEYFEVLKEPMFKHDHKEMTEEEKQKRLQLLIAGLRTKQANFELKKGK